MSLWSPSQERISSSQMAAFQQRIQQKFDSAVRDYEALHRWSVEHLDQFWAEIWEIAGIRASVPFTQVIDDPKRMPGAKWFNGARLNFAENLLRFSDDRVALISANESGVRSRLTYGQLQLQVGALAAGMRSLGIGPSSRVAGFVPNISETVIAMLAATSIGAVWSSSSPDFGIDAVLDRFNQIQPEILVTADAYWFKGKEIDCLARANEIANRIDSIKTIVVIGYASSKPDLSGFSKSARHFSDLTEKPAALEFAQLPFDHPVYIMYSSGTTGLPKCMVQGPGVLLNHLKELILHTDLRRDDTIFYFTTCGWMMWNWLVSSLAIGSRIVLFDGNPFHPDPAVLLELAEKESISIFGTSAKYLSALEGAGVIPRDRFNLSSLRTILSTGSPLSRESYQYVYQKIKSDVQLSSISGGTDLNGCFALGNPMLPVFEGELQSRGLGMAVEVWDDSGKSVCREKGELVCTRAFPSMPLFFWNDADGQKYHRAYFDMFPGIWRHGDFAEITEHNGMVIYGRSDATLNPGGVRIGTADLYRVIETFPEIEDSVVIGQEWENDQRVILFVKMKNGTLSEDIKKQISKKIRDTISPRHVPAFIFQTPDVPYTRNLKKVELAVKRTVQNEPVTNRDALVNPECLEYFKNIPELQK
ncbi:MAG: acetoacetate--CoA ligase [Leptospirales bacterium]|nr:acetoacetate--CoA ligase [Leptospirales bacterium]